MRKLAVLLLFIFFVCPSFAKNEVKLDVDSASFTDIGRYIETFEVNDEPADEEITETEDSFEEEAFDEVSKRYEENAVVLKLDENSDSILDIVNRDRIFKLRVNEDKFNIENNIRAENMIWDSSKTFTQAFFNDSRHMAPIPSVINNSRIIANASPNVSASLGQTNLYDANGPSVLFIRANESTYNMGSVISYRGEGLNLSVGSFSSSYNNAASGGAVLTSNPLKLPYNIGKITLGGGYFANENVNYDKYTFGSFVEYSVKRLKLNAQIGESRYSDTVNYDTSLYFIPELRLTDSLYLKTRFIRNLSQNIMQDELALTYKPKGNINNLEFEINTSNQYNQNENINRRIKFTTSFKI